MPLAVSDDYFVSQFTDAVPPDMPPLTQTNPAPPAEIVTTLDVNGPDGGTVDDGGPIDQFVWQLTEAQRNSALGTFLSSMQAANDASIARLGMPLAVPTVQSTIQRLSIMALGGFIGGYHGYQRSRGRGLQTLGWGLAGVILPIGTLGVALVQGYGKPRAGKARG